MKQELLAFCLVAMSVMTTTAQERVVRLRRQDEQMLLDREEESLWGRLLEDFDSMPGKSGGKKGGKGGTGSMPKDVRAGGKKGGGKKGDDDDDSGVDKDGDKITEKRKGASGKGSGKNDGGSSYRNRDRLLNVV